MACKVWKFMSEEDLPKGTSKFITQPNEIFPYRRLRVGTLNWLAAEGHHAYDTTLQVRNV